MSITPAQLGKIAPNLKEPKLTMWAGAISSAMELYGIITKHQQAAFLAQIMHESGECRYVKELASGEAYEGRKDLGNTVKGDGVRYKGRGLVQITGRTNYTTLSKAFGQDFINKPELLEQAEFAAKSAAWFWNSRSLNQYATGTDDGFKTITKRINGGYTGLEDRQKYWARAKSVLGA